MLPVIFRNACAPRSVANPWSDWGRDMPSLFDEVFGNRDLPSSAVGRVDAWENDSQVVIETELPGMSESDVNVTVDQGVLTIEAEKKDEREQEGRDYHMAERRYGKVVRRFRLADTVDADKIEASLVDGVLTVTLGKKELPQPTKIEVKPGTNG